MRKLKDNDFKKVIFSKESRLTLFISVVIMLIGAFKLFTGDKTLGLVFLCLGIVFLASIFSLHAKDLDFTVLENDAVFLSYISEGKKIKAVKYCRSKVKCGLKEALDYVEKVM